MGDNQNTIIFIQILFGAYPYPCHTFEPFFTQMIQNLKNYLKINSAASKIGGAVIKIGPIPIKSGGTVVKTEPVSIKSGDAAVKTGNAAIKIGDAVVKIGNAAIKTGSVAVKIGNAAIKTGSVAVKSGGTATKTGSAVIKMRPACPDLSVVPSKRGTSPPEIPPFFLQPPASHVRP